jgi:uncharacterized protein with HEPN domain
MLREELYLHDIIEASKAIEKYLLNVEKSTFMASDLLQSAVLHKLMIIGEACSKVPKDLRDKYPKVEWKQIIGFRNIAVHAYFSVNLDIVWKAATVESKILSQQIAEILQNEFPDFEYKPKN